MVAMVEEQEDVLDSLFRDWSELPIYDPEEDDAEEAGKVAKKYLVEVLRHHTFNPNLVKEAEGDNDTHLITYNDLYKQAGIKKCFEDMEMVDYCEEGARKLEILKALPLAMPALEQQPHETDNPKD